MRIEFHLANSVQHGGTPVTGKICILGQGTYNAVELVLLGCIEFDWYDTSGNIKYTYGLQQVIYSKGAVLAKLVEDRTIEGGEVELPFSLPFECGLPPSVRLADGRIEYTLECRVKHGARFSKTVKRFTYLKVAPPLSVKLLKARLHLPYVGRKVCTSGNIGVTCTMNRNVIVSGGEVTMDVIFDNQTKVTLTDIVFRAFEATEFTLGATRPSSRHAFTELYKAKHTVCVKSFQMQNGSFTFHWPTNGQADYDVGLVNIVHLIEVCIPGYKGGKPVLKIPILVLPRHKVSEQIMELLPRVKCKLNDEFTRPEWQLDQEAAVCVHCKTKFTMFKRRHHCRACGLVVCDRCSCSRLRLPTCYAMVEMHRVCDSCRPYVLDGKCPPQVAAMLDNEDECNETEETSTRVSEALEQLPPTFTAPDLWTPPTGEVSESLS